MNTKINLDLMSSGKIISIADGIAIVSGMGAAVSGE
jgi:hypothetical protein